MFEFIQVNENKIKWKYYVSLKYKLNKIMRKYKIQCIMQERKRIDVYTMIMKVFDS